MATTSTSDSGHHTLLLGQVIAPPLSARFPGLDPEEVEDAIEDSIVDALCNANTPGIVTKAWLYRAAWRNLRDRAASISARRRRERLWAHETFSDLPVAPDPARLRDKNEQIRRIIDRIEERLPEDERAILRLLLEGVRDTEMYASALHFTHLTPHRKRAAVRRVKDRAYRLVPVAAREACPTSTADSDIGASFRGVWPQTRLDRMRSE